MTSSTDTPADPVVRTRPGCATTRSEKLMRGVAAVFVAGFALSNATNLWSAIPTGICSVILMVGAVTGWCPGDLLRRGAIPAEEPNAFGIPEAPQQVGVRRQ